MIYTYIFFFFHIHLKKTQLCLTTQHCNMAKKRLSNKHLIILCYTLSVSSFLPEPYPYIFLGLSYLWSCYLFFSENPYLLSLSFNWYLFFRLFISLFVNFLFLWFSHYQQFTFLHFLIFSSSYLPFIYSASFLFLFSIFLNFIFFTLPPSVLSLFCGSMRFKNFNEKHVYTEVIVTIVTMAIKITALERRSVKFNKALGSSQS